MLCDQVIILTDVLVWVFFIYFKCENYLHAEMCSINWNLSFLSCFLYPEYPFKSNYLTVHGHRLHYLEEGRGPVIVMVHGNPTWSYYYRRLVTLLSRTHRVIVPDHLGCGLSEKPQEDIYSLNNHIDHLNLLLDHLNVINYSMIVHHWGGPIG